MVFGKFPVRQLRAYVVRCNDELWVVGCCTKFPSEFLRCLERRDEAEVPLHVLFMLVSGGLDSGVLRPLGILNCLCIYGAAFTFQCLCSSLLT